MNEPMRAFEMHCQYCFTRFEDQVYEALLKKIKEHEAECPMKRR